MQRMLIGIVIGTLTLALLGWLTLTAWARMARPATGWRGGDLAPCGNKPNCVCSVDPRSEYLIRPLPGGIDAAQTREAIRRVVGQIPRTRLVTDEPNYMHYECRSPLIGYVDDLEFHITSDSGEIHVRSASRVGYSDLGVNRRRVEAIRAAWPSIFREAGRSKRN